MSPRWPSSSVVPPPAEPCPPPQALALQEEERAALAETLAGLQQSLAEATAELEQQRREVTSHQEKEQVGGRFLGPPPEWDTAPRVSHVPLHCKPLSLGTPPLQTPMLGHPPYCKPQCPRLTLSPLQGVSLDPLPPCSPPNDPPLLAAPQLQSPPSPHSEPPGNGDARVQYLSIFIPIPAPAPWQHPPPYASRTPTPPGWGGAQGAVPPLPPYRAWQRSYAACGCRQRRRQWPTSGRQRLFVSK